MNIMILVDLFTPSIYSRIMYDDIQIFEDSPPLPLLANAYEKRGGACSHRSNHQRTAA